MSDELLIIIGLSLGGIGTVIGAAFVFIFKKRIPSQLNTIFLGFSAGVMIAASVWSLLIPAIEQAETLSPFENVAWLPALIGFLCGGLFLFAIDKIVPHLHGATNEEEGPHTRKLSRGWKLFLAMTIHNIPEGLAVGFAFGAALALQEQHATTSMTLIGAMALAIGMFIQNLPEGAAVSMPLFSETGSRRRAFNLGAFSGLVEPVFAVVGFFLAFEIVVLLPWLLAFAAGAMIYVVAEELIPGANSEENPHLGTFGVMAGFAIMMVLDVALG